MPDVFTDYDQSDDVSSMTSESLELRSEDWLLLSGKGVVGRAATLEEKVNSRNNMYYNHDSSCSTSRMSDSFIHTT